ncbi:hypothetical protein BH20ACT9_BH20ACT9_00910 [soil metagenome]
MSDASRRSLREGARAAAPLAVAVAAFGVSFGVLARAAGLGALAPVVMSATTFAGSAQFAAVSVLASDGGVTAATVAAVLLNARYLPIGVSVAGAFGGGAGRRLLQSQLLVDESWAVGQTPQGVDRHRLLGAGAVLYAAWLAGTAVGVAGGRVLASPERLGLDAALPALFLALLVPQLRGRRSLAAAAAGAGIALALTPLTPPGVPIVVASVACLAGWRGGEARPK